VHLVLVVVSANPRNIQPRVLHHGLRVALTDRELAHQAQHPPVVTGNELVEGVAVSLKPQREQLMVVGVFQLVGWDAMGVVVTAGDGAGSLCHSRPAGQRHLRSSPTRHPVPR
jgi:hypothetical protein